MVRHVSENRGGGSLAARMRQRITLQTANRSADGAGGYASTWDTLDTVWAEVRALSGSERVLQQQRQSRLQYRVVLRHRDDVTPGMRVQFSSKTLDILAVIDDDATAETLTLLCEAIDP